MNISINIKYFFTAVIFFINVGITARSISLENKTDKDVTISLSSPPHPLRTIAVLKAHESKTVQVPTVCKEEASCNDKLIVLMSGGDINASSNLSPDKNTFSIQFNGPKLAITAA